MRRPLALLPLGISAALWLKGRQPQLPGWPCPFQALTGVPCPTCFLTRATAAALNGELQTAVQLHAFGPLVAAVLLLMGVHALWRGRLLPLQLRFWPQKPAAVLLAAGLLLYWLLRLFCSYALGLRGFPGFPAG